MQKCATQVVFGSVRANQNLLTDVISVFSLDKLRSGSYILCSTASIEYPTFYSERFPKKHNSKAEHDYVYSQIQREVRTSRTIYPFTILQR